MSVCACLLVRVDVGLSVAAADETALKSGIAALRCGAHLPCVRARRDLLAHSPLRVAGVMDRGRGRHSTSSMHVKDRHVEMRSSGGRGLGGCACAGRVRVSVRVRSSVSHTHPHTHARTCTPPPPAEEGHSQTRDVCGLLFCPSSPPPPPRSSLLVSFHLFLTLLAEAFLSFHFFFDLRFSLFSSSELLVFALGVACAP